MVNRRGLLAAVLGFLYPGLGHVYLRRWLRALTWFVLALATAALVVPPEAYEAFRARGFAGLMEASESFGPQVTLSLLVVRVLNVADAYLIAVREAAPSGGSGAVSGAGGAGSSDAATCPHCGKELDEDIDFCPWCTERIEEGESREDAESA